MIKIDLSTEEKETILRALDDRHGLLSGIITVESGETKDDLKHEIDLIEAVLEKLAIKEIKQ